ncbi:MAG: dockerin type I repeat-containing protein [Phycisphaerales bacterium]|nr:dockerin type I repeat-containing protein [Phycisphaerales bacterium]
MRYLCITMMLIGFSALSPRADGGAGCPFQCADVDGDGSINDADFALFASCLGEDPQSAPQCDCSDMDGNGQIDLADFALFTLLFQNVSDESPPGCTGALGSTANLTAYRPQHGNGYAPFPRTPVPDNLETDPWLGPGIRINQPGDDDPQGEDDLIELVLDVSPPGAALALHRSSSTLHVWTSHTKTPGSEIAFTGDKTSTLPIGPGDSSLTLWVEWTTGFGTAALTVEPPTTSVVKDEILFHAFESIVVALGGENQPTSVPVDPNHGTFLVGIAMYNVGFDVHMFDEDVVGSDGSGEAYNTVVDAIVNRQVDKVAIFGYSHGGGSTYDMADRLDINRAGIGVFSILYTSYVDAVGNNSDVDTSMELRRPPSTGYHLNHYQHGSFFEDLSLDGGPVPNSNPPPTGLDIETTPWGATSTHFEVDDFIEVRSLMESTIESNVTR